jgi:GntR family transcriptional regulator/MocR family aminotransferase
MGRQRILLDWLAVSPEAEQPLYRQIAQQIATAVHERRLMPGIYLPASRTLATQLGISRITVLSAYEQLVADGVLETISGSGTRVRHPALVAHTEANDVATAAPHVGASVAAATTSGQPRSKPLAFLPGTPALDMFPRQVWSQMLRRYALRGDAELLANEHHGGYRPLRQMIARYLVSSRGVDCEPTEVVIVGSTRAAINIACALLTRSGEKAAFDDPGYYRARTSFESYNLLPVPVPVDDAGLCVPQLVSGVPDARIVYTTPSHHWPTGVTLRGDRRRELLAWAERTGAWILEDDYDSEFHFEGPPPLPLRAAADSSHVIFMGTFSWTLAPSIRCAYLIAPRSLARGFTDYAIRLGVEPPLQIQAALAHFIEQGYFTRHIQRMRKAYRARRDALRKALAESLGHVVSIRPSAGGLQLIADLPTHIPADSVARLAASQELSVRALSRYCVDAIAPNALHLGFAAVPIPQIGPAVRRLASLLRIAR